MAARESEDADIMTTISVPNTNDISDDEEMSDATEKKDVGHTRRGVSPIHIPAEWGKAEPTGDGDPESLERRQQRAKRFGVSASETEEKSATTSDLDLDSLYKSLGVSTRSEERLRVEGIREEAIHIRGIDNMTTQDVFHFFKDFNPGSIEWIDETSCNVMWLDDETSARALLKLTYDVEHVPDFSEPGQTSKSAVKAQEEGMDVDGSGGTGDNTRPRSGRRRNASDDDNLDLLSSDDSDSGHESSSREDSEADEETGEKDRGPDEETGEKKRKSHGRGHVTAAGGAAVNGTAAAVGSSETAAKVTAAGDHAEGMELEEGEIPRVRSFRSEGKEVSLPRGRWRVGLLHGKKKFLFLRFATKADVKAPGARVPSQYYMPQSLPVYTGIKGLTSESRKRRFRAAAQWGQEGEGDLGVGFDARNEILNRAEVRSSTAPEPGLTSMDRHMTAAQTERVRLHKHRVGSDEEADALDAEAELAVLLSSSPPTDAPPPTKRKMRMYADDLEEQKKSKSATVVSRVASARDARSMIESRRRGKVVGSERLSHTQDDLDLSDDPPAPRPSDRRGQHRDLRDRLGRRRNDLDTDRDNYGDGLGRRKDDLFEGRRKYEKLTIEVQQD